MIRNQYIFQENRAVGIRDAAIEASMGSAPETYAQSGEDIIISGLLLAYTRRRNRTPDTITYIEIGANHPVSTSNTYLLYKKYGARGLLVEADPTLIDDLRRVRPRDRVLHSAVSTSGEKHVTLHVGNASELSSLNADHVRSFGEFAGHGGIAREVSVPNTHINDVLATAGGHPPDLLSIDCEGLDYDLLLAVDFEKYRPYIVQCEPSEHFTPGNRDKMIRLMQSRSYRLEAMTEINLIFTRRWRWSLRNLFAALRHRPSKRMLARPAG